MRVKTTKKGKKGATGPKRISVDAREEDLEVIAKMHRQGYSQREIGEKLGLSGPTICNELKVIRERYKAEAMQDRKVLVVRELNLLMDLRREAFEAWERSKKPAEVRVEEEGSSDAKGGWSKTVERSSGQVGDPAFLSLVRETSSDLRELMGLDEAVKIDVSGEIKHHILNWATLLNSAAADPSTEVEDRLEAERVRLGIADKKDGEE